MHLAERSRVYGLEIALFCPICREELPITFHFGSDTLESSILRLATMHRYVPCDPALRWVPEQRGYIRPCT